jgi:DNA polymerase elongation subunit (family B)
MQTLDYKALHPQIANNTFHFYNFYNLDLDSRIFYGVKYYENAKEEVEETEQILRVVFVDIESYRVDKNLEFSFTEALHPISAISFYYNKVYYCYFLNINDHKIDIDEWQTYFKQELVNNNYIVDDQIKIVVFTDELTLLAAFWRKIKEIDPVILSGWNSHSFDYPYIYKRMMILLNNNEADVGKIISTFNYAKLKNDRVDIPDYTICDLMFLYMPREDGGRNYGRKQASYSLDHVSDVELGLKKFEYKSKNIDLDDFYDNDPRGYLFYNAVDVILCVKLNEKLKHIELHNGIRRSMKCPFEKSLIGVSAIFDSFVLDKLNKRIRFGMVNQHNKHLPVEYLSSLPTAIINDKTKTLLSPIEITATDYISQVTKYDGAYVTQPLADIKNKGIVFSLDATSMYPSMMIQYNISFDVYKSRIVPSTVYKLINFLNATLGKTREIPQSLSRSVFLTVDTYIKNKDIANKEKTRKVLYFSAIFILSRLYNSGLEFSKIIRPSNDTEQIFLSFYLLHLFEIINLTHPENFTYNDIIYTYLFNETKFTEKYPEIYIIENVNTPYESIVKLSAMQTLEYMKKYIVTITGDCFVKHDQQIGLFTNMLEEFSKKRKIFQSKMDQYPKGSVEYQLYNNRQNATKIVMNSNYGVQGLKSFRYSNSHLAQCITTQGRLTIKLAQYVSDKYLDSKNVKT